MLLLMPQKFNIPTLKIRPSIAHAMQHNQTRSHRLKLRPKALGSLACTRVAPEVRMLAIRTPGTPRVRHMQERACEDEEGWIA